MKNFYYKLNVPTRDIRNTNIYCIRTENGGIPMDIKLKKNKKPLPYLSSWRIHILL